MKCLRKYQWVKLPRDIPDMGKGLMAHWAVLASRAAFRKGNASYCGHNNPVAPGMWAGGVVGLKSILGAKSRTKALQILDKLSCLGFLKYSLDSQTKKLTYEITDWVVKCSGAECMSGTLYPSTGYVFLCLPRSITQRLADAKRVFDKADAWLDLWCHTTYEDYGNAFSFLAPVVQYGRFGSVLTLETLGERWGWEKTKVWRFFKKHGDVFPLYRLPSSYGCLVFNTFYPTGADTQLPEQDMVMRILREILICSTYKCKGNRGCCTSGDGYFFWIGAGTHILLVYRRIRVADFLHIVGTRGNAIDRNGAVGIRCMRAGYQGRAAGVGIDAESPAGKIRPVIRFLRQSQPAGIELVHETDRCRAAVDNRNLLGIGAGAYVQALNTGIDMPQFFDIIGACGKAGNGDSAAGICSVRAGNEAGAGGVGIDPKLPSG